MPKPRARDVEVADGELGLVRAGRAHAHNYSPVEREHWHSMLAHIELERGYKQGWAKANYKEKFGSWPAWGVEVEPTAPSPEVYRWVKSRQIAYHKRMGV